MITRRHFATGLAAAALTAPATAQTRGVVFRLGVLDSSQVYGPVMRGSELITESLAGMGFVAEKNLTLVRRSFMGDLTKLPAVLQDLITTGVDVILTVGYSAAAAAKSSGLPVVSLFAGDPVATGLVQSLSHPGGNVTGMFEDETALSIKRLALLRDAIPHFHKVAILWNVDDLGMALRYQASAKVAEALGLEIQSLAVRVPEDFNRAFAAMDDSKPDSILMLSDGLVRLNHARVLDYATAHKLPAISEYALFTRDGALLSYGSDVDEDLQRCAVLAARIFKGERPANLPFEQATRYQLAVNLKTAATIGLDIPLSILARADEVIE